MSALDSRSSAPYGDILGVECAWPADADRLWTAPRPAPPALAGRLLAVATFALVAIGLWQMGHGVYIQAKARLAQVLIERAWDETRAGIAQAKPWPWADTWPVARLQAPARGIELYVLAGANGRTIAFGPGHVFGTPLPGEPGNSAIGGHRDTHFAFLQGLGKGDLIQVENARGEWLSYRVAGAQIVDKEDVGVLAQPARGRHLTLITCYPFDALRAGGPLRYVVSAVAEGAPAQAPGPPVRETGKWRIAT